MEEVFKADPEESKKPDGALEHSAEQKRTREPMWHRISGESLKVTFDYQIVEEAAEEEEEQKQ